MKKNPFIGIIIVIGIIIILIFVPFLWPSIPNNYKENNKEYFKEISYTVPSEFELDDYHHSRNYSYYDTSLNCYIDIRAQEKLREQSFEKWFKGDISFTLNDELSELEELEINGNKILGIQKRRGEDYSWSEVEYYYGVESSNYYYMIEYRIIDYKNGDRTDTETSMCLSTLDTFLSSIKTK